MKWEVGVKTCKILQYVMDQQQKSYHIAQRAIEYIQYTTIDHNGKEY